MANVNPMLHMDKVFMWRWYEIDDYGQMAFSSPKSFFSLEDCRRDYDQAMRRLKRNVM